MKVAPEGNLYPCEIMVNMKTRQALKYPKCLYASVLRRKYTVIACFRNMEDLHSILYLNASCADVQPKLLLLLLLLL